MRLRKKLGVTMATQVLGIGATALGNVVISRRYGPEGQGYLSAFRANAELLQSIGLYGFAQAFIYMINAGRIEEGWAAKASTLYGAAWAFLGVGFVGLCHAAGVREISGYGLMAILAMVATSAGLLLYGLYRSIILAARPILVFNLVSILPSTLALAGYFAWRPVDHRRLVGVLVASSILACLVAAGTLRTALRPRFRWWVESGPKIREAAVYGAWSFVPNVAINVVLVATYSLLRRGGGAEESAGYFSVSNLLVSTVVLPLNMVIPILFDVWSKEKDRKNMAPLYMRLSHLGTVVMAAGLALGLPLVRPLTVMVFGQRFSPSIVATEILLLGVYAIYQSRLLGALLLGLGRPAAVATAAAARAGVIVAPMALGWTDSLAGAALLWVAGEYVSMLLMMAVVRRETAWKPTEIAGFSWPWTLRMIREGARGFGAGAG